MTGVLRLFGVREQRKVDDVFCDVRVKGLFFAVDVKYRGDKVSVRYDPFSKLEEVRLFSPEGQFLQVAKRYERERGAHPQPEKPANETPLDHEYLKLLQERHEQEQQAEAKQGLDYHQAQTRHLWSFAQFAAKFAKLLGRKGGASGLSTQEMERLAEIHRNYPRITESFLEQAFQQAEHKTIPVIVFHLQNLLSR
jgi:hypothetical protein